MMGSLTAGRGPKLESWYSIAILQEYASTVTPTDTINGRQNTGRI
jgi:hypothetical protein